jgi:hypothetical protein
MGQMQSCFKKTSSPGNKNVEVNLTYRSLWSRCKGQEGPPIIHSFIHSFKLTLRLAAYRQSVLLGVKLPETHGQRFSSAETKELIALFPFMLYRPYRK